jgi:hypothetical protein
MENVLLDVILNKVKDLVYGKTRFFSFASE